MKNRKLLLSMLLFTVMGIMTSAAMSAPYMEGEVVGWTQLGPNNYAGRASAALFDKNKDGVVYVGTVGGLYVSVNYGKNWREIPLGDAVYNVTAITQSDNGRLYVATGDGTYRTYRGEMSQSRSNQVSSQVGGGVFMQTEGMDAAWDASLSDAEKYARIVDNFKFEAMTNTVPDSKYDYEGDFAYINTILYANNTLYVGTVNRGLKRTSDVENKDAAFTNVTIDGNTKFNVYDLQVNSLNQIAVAYDGMVAVDDANGNFKVIFNSDADTENPFNARGFGKIKLAYATKNPNDLFIFASANYNTQPYKPTDNGLIYGVYRPYREKIGGTVANDASLYTLAPTSNNWFNITTTSMALLAGSSLQYGMSIVVDDRTEGDEIVYLGGNEVYAGQDYNKEGKFSFSQMTSATDLDTAGNGVGININNILFMPEKKSAAMTAYDSLFTLVTSDMGVFVRSYDTILGVYRWWPSSQGMNNLQTYDVTATADGSVFAATQSNAIVYIPTAKDTVQRGFKVWSINNPNYPLLSSKTNLPTYYGGDFNDYTYSGSSVNASAIYKTTPLIRKPVLLARPGTNIARTYSNGGDYDAIDDQTWTYGDTGAVAQSLLIAPMISDYNFDQFNTPIAYWESFDMTNSIDSIVVSVGEHTLLRGWRKVKVMQGEQEIEKDSLCNLEMIDGTFVFDGDTILVESGNLSYPFFHVMHASDLITVDPDSYRQTTGDTLFEKLSDFEMKIPQPVQARALVATNRGAFICGKIMDFSKTIDPTAAAEQRWGQLTWAKVYRTGAQSSSDDYSTMNTRINAVALSADGNTAYLAIDNYSSFTAYTNTTLVRITGLNDVAINNDEIFRGNDNDINTFEANTAVIGTFNRPISAIVCDPQNINNVLLTFEGSSNAANVMQTVNALDEASSVSFSDISLTINRNGETVSKEKPVFSGLYESVNAGKTNPSGRIYVGSDDGIYYRANGQWVSDNENMPSVPVYDLWQQTKKLPKWTYYSYIGQNSEFTTFEATKNTGVIYAATYGRGIMRNTDFQDTIPIESNVALVDVENGNSSNISIAVYPNPAVDEATIAYTLNDAANVTFRLVDLNGREVSQFDGGRQAKGTHTQILDVQNLQRGIYVIQMITDKASSNVKLIVK